MDMEVQERVKDCVADGVKTPEKEKCSSETVAGFSKPTRHSGKRLPFGIAENLAARFGNSSPGWKLE